MRPQKRLKCPAPPNKVEHWTRLWLATLERNPNAQFHWPNMAKKRTLSELFRPVLEQMTQNHCSYCDGFPLGALSMKTIDHFRPRTRFPELAFAWANLFLACQRCQMLKSDQFKEILLKPDERGYRFRDYFVYYTLSGDLQPDYTRPAEIQERAAETIRCFQLNAPELRADRKRWFRIQAALQAAGKGLELDALPYRYLFEAMGTWEI